MGKLACLMGGLAVVSFVVIGSEKPAFATPTEGEPRKEAIDWRGIYKAPAPTDGIEVSPLFGYASNGFGVGAGMRAGYTFKEGAYVGAAFMYQHGIDQAPGDATARVGMLYPSAEVGYDLRYESVTFRPYAGAGIAWLYMNTTLGSAMGDASFVAYPGLAITYHPERSMIFAGVDSRLVVPVIEKANLTDVMSVGVYAVAGIHF